MDEPLFSLSNMKGRDSAAAVAEASAPAAHELAELEHDSSDDDEVAGQFPELDSDADEDERRM